MLNYKVKGINRAKRYREHASGDNVSYTKRITNVVNGMSFEDALIRKEKKIKAYKKRNSKLEENERLLKFGGVSNKNETLNIVSNKEEYIVILNAYENQISSYDLTIKEEEKECEKLKEERNRFILQYMNSLEIQRGVK